MPPKKKINTKSPVVISGNKAVVLPKVSTNDPKPKKRKKIDPSKIPSEKAIIEKLTTARIALLMKQPFFGSMATRLALVRDDNMPTAATDGINFYYNLEFIAGLTAKETEFLFGHEVLHNVFEHHLRKHFPDGVTVDEHKSRHHKAWNIACDYAINDILIESKIGDKIEGTLHDPKYKGMCAEQIYDELMENATEMDLDQLAEHLLDEHMDGLAKNGKNLTEEEKQQVRNDIKQSLMDAYQASAGNVPVGVERLVKSITSPKISWRDELRQDIQSVVKFDYSFYRPSRKGMSDGIVLPGMKRDESIEVCVAIDCSGSISEADIAKFLGEIGGIMQQYDEYNIRVWSFDTKVYNDETFRSDEGRDIRTYKTCGGGGTMFECNWDHMRQNDISPKVFILFTDMQPCGSWGDPDYCEDVIFVGYRSGNITAPFGKTIQLND